ncbi:MAG TPA: hypothetical protein VG983_00420 [Caulobacterales bacterium]|jgi:hypothetical protein|nr:hypothetical protein [Caulobacterales bacterium]
MKAPPTLGFTGQRFAGLGLAGLAAALAAPAHAENAFSGDQLRGFLEVRATAADGARGWLDDGDGKTRFGEGGHGLADAMLVWRPHLTWSLDAHVTLLADTQADPALDIGEAYLSYRGPPAAGWRLSARAGLFYPPVSLEHDGVGWTPTYTITPSALNSWISEEVKVGAAEITARREFGAQDLSVSAALFGFNDTAGTLLAFRGWALGDVMAGAFGKVPLPAYSYQRATAPVRELDGRIGYYARVRYRPAGPLALEAFYYDNAGDRVSDKNGQTDWDTSFAELGADLALGAKSRLLLQVMNGRTRWGQPTAQGYWSDLDFTAAYALVTHDIGANTITARWDYFDLRDRSGFDPADNGETGWAATAAYIAPLSPSWRLAFEAMHVSSDRPERDEIGLAPRQRQSILQSSLKFSF